MPTETYWNLPEDKRGRIFDAAVAEFASRPFSKASINRIVKDAGIPRGSFYQYFEDKEDLYLYLLTEIGKEKLTAIQTAPPLDPDADLFDTILYMVRTALRWAKSRPDYDRIGHLMDLDDSRFISRLRERNREGMTMISDLIVRDQKRGRIRSDVDPDVLVDMIYLTVFRRLSDLYKEETTDETLMEGLLLAIDILKRGIAHEHPAG